MAVTFERLAPATSQYSLAKILAVWAAVTAPMAFLAWVVAPFLISRIPVHPGILYWLLIIVGMVWQFIVAAYVLRKERRNWTWDKLKARLWLTAPREPRTGRRDIRLYWWVIGGILFVGLTSDILGTYIDKPFQHLFPNVHPPAYGEIESLIDDSFMGAWWLLAIALTSNIFNYFLGEALLFHGVLLPKMIGVFGRRAWLANAFLFGVYHLHLFWELPSIIVSNFAYSFPAQRYRSVWFAVIIHGFEGLVVTGAVVWVIMGMPGR